MTKLHTYVYDYDGETVREYVDGEERPTLGMRIGRSVVTQGAVTGRDRKRLENWLQGKSQPWWDRWLAGVERAVRRGMALATRKERTG